MNVEQIKHIKDRKERVKEVQKLREHLEAIGVTPVTTIMQTLTGMTKGQICGDLRDYRKWYGTTERIQSQPSDKPSAIQSTSIAAPFEYPIYTVDVDEPPLQPLPSFTAIPELHGDFIVVGDIHIPTTDWTFAERMFETALKHLTPPRQLIIAGDLLNLNQISRYTDTVATPAIRDELRAADQFIRRVIQVFDQTLMIMGNHDIRMLALFSGNLMVEQFAHLITDAQDRIRFSTYAECYLISGGERWYVVHQTNYRQTKLSVGMDLSAKKGCNVITTHQHHSAVGRDRGNRFTVVDCGGLHEPTQMPYVAQRPSTRPDMNKGFVLLKNGCANLLTPYRTMTDWSLWFPKAQSIC